MTPPPPKGRSIIAMVSDRRIVHDKTRDILALMAGGERSSCIDLTNRLSLFEKASLLRIFW